MEIKLAKETQLLEVLYIIRECAEQLMDKGVRSWHNTHADYSEISKDISNKYVFIVFLKGVPVGTITVKPLDDASGTSTIDRLAVFPHFQRRGLARAAIDFAELHARQNGFKTLRGTIPVEDKSLCKLLEDKGFVSLGVTPRTPNELERMIFEKKLV